MLAGKRLFSPANLSAATMHLGPSLPSNHARRSAWQARARPVFMTTLVAVLVFLLAIAMLVVVRRLTGAFSNDLPPAAVLLTALVTTAALACTRIAWRRHLARDSRFDTVVGWGSSLALAFLAIGCSYPAYRTSDWLIWLPLLVADQLWRQNFFDAGRPTVGTTRSASVLEEPFVAAPLRQGGSASPHTEPANADQEDVVQQLFRVRDDSGREVIYGALRADFLAGQRMAVVHAGFCPPLAYLPEIEAESLPGQTTRIKVVQALSHGVRLDVRLTAIPEEDCHVWIDMAAKPVSPKSQMISA